jgi:hypothetical protein
MDMKGKYWILILFAGAVFVAPSSAQGTRETKTEKMLKEIKAPYKPFQGQNSFIVLYNGKEKKDIDLIAVEAGSGLAIFADVAAGREVDLTLEVMHKLLEYNLKTDYIKIGISDIGSIRVQSEQNLILINSKAFSEILDQIAAGVDDVSRILKPVYKAR